MSYFVTGIGTGIGKTVISAILTEKLKADYWKPVQAGDLDQSDSIAVKHLLTNTETTIHPETYRLTHPLSPHLSAKLDGIHLSLDDFLMPANNGNLIIEGAGGLMVPLNNEHLVIDLIKKLDVEVVLVSQNYLGSINHTLLSVGLLRQYEIPVKGVIFNGIENKETQDYILNYTGISFLGHVPQMDQVTKENVQAFGRYITI